jgi:hypothetical protein
VSTIWQKLFYDVKRSAASKASLARLLPRIRGSTSECTDEPPAGAGVKYRPTPFDGVILSSHFC